MKNLLNCHCIGLHSFPVSLSPEGLYTRIFYADNNHELYKPVELAIHPHHVDIKITVLDGILYNPLYVLDKKGPKFKKFKWNSHILSGKGSFEYLGKQGLTQVSTIGYKAGESTVMKSCELHTVQVALGERCVWVIEESKPSCDYFPINYSNNDLTKWNTEHLYKECDDKIRDYYIGKYLNKIKDA